MARQNILRTGSVIILKNDAGQELTAKIDITKPAGAMQIIYAKPEGSTASIRLIRKKEDTVFNDEAGAKWTLTERKKPQAVPARSRSARVPQPERDAFEAAARAAAVALQPGQKLVLRLEVNGRKVIAQVRDFKGRKVKA
jgi:hypothetical protein